MVMLFGASFSHAQDAATEERLNKLSGQIEDLLAAMAKQDKRISALEKELDAVREQANKPTGNFAGADDVRKLAEKVREVDQKRVEDNERIVAQIKELGKLAAAPSGGSKHSSSGSSNDGSKKVTPLPPSTPEKGFEYTVNSGDTLSTIVAAYREQGVKVSVDQVLKANPGLKEKSLKVGQKIFIPKS